LSVSYIVVHLCQYAEIIEKDACRATQLDDSAACPAGCTNLGAQLDQTLWRVATTSLSICFGGTGMSISCSGTAEQTGVYGEIAGGFDLSNSQARTREGNFVKRSGCRSAVDILGPWRSWWQEGGLILRFSGSTGMTAW